MNDFEEMMRCVAETGRKVCAIVTQKVQAYSDLIDKTNAEFAKKSSGELQQITGDHAYGWTQRAIAGKILKERAEEGTVLEETASTSVQN